MKTLVITLPLNTQHQEQFKKVVGNHHVVFCKSSELDLSLVQSAHAMIGHIPDKLIKGSTNLEWLQLQSAGTGGYVSLAKELGFLLTNASGAYGLAISEHMLGMTLCLQKNIHRYIVNKQHALWQDEGNVRSISSSTVLIIGLGDIGSSYAKKCKALGSRTIGIRRTVRQKPDEVDAVFTLEDIDELLPQADIVACCLPETNETMQLMNADRINLMKKGSILLNVGRGSVIDQIALSKALVSGHLGGAGIDVTDPEPLPKTHELWNAPNLIITPHVSGGYHMAETLESIVAISVENTKRFLSGKKLHNVVDFETGYRML